MKICLIGPTYPFRGGISHYTTLLYRSLRLRHEVTFISFTRQYPQLLFPGKTDLDTSQKEFREEGVLRLIDSCNPFTWIRAALEVRTQNPDLLILPWWVSFWAPQFWTITTLVKILTKVRVLFICHNVVEHESKRLDKVLTKLVLKKAH